MKPALEIEERPMTEAERRLARCHADRVRRQRSRQRPAILAATAIVTGLLWGATVLASDAPLWVVSAFWAVVGGGLAVWLGRESVGPDEAWSREIDRAIRRGTVSEIRVTCARYARIEEYEDEGPCLALERPDGTLTFLTGPDAEPTPRFPSRDMRFVRLLAGTGEPILWMRRCLGGPAPEARVLPGETKLRMRWPDDLEVVPGTLEDLERVLEMDS